MASSGNTWQKKLMNKARLHSLKVRGVKARFSIDKQPKTTKPKERDFYAPKVVGFKARGFGKKFAPKVTRGFNLAA